MVFVVKSVTLAFERLGVDGAKMDLVTSTLYEGFGGTWAETLRQPTELFEACSHHAFVTASQFTRAVSTTSIKPRVDSSNAYLLPFAIALHLLSLSNSLAVFHLQQLRLFDQDDGMLQYAWRGCRC
jgi:hypothetical protein